MLLTTLKTTQPAEALARFIKTLVENFLSGVGFDRLPKKLGLTFMEPNEERTALSAIGGTVAMLINPSGATPWLRIPMRSPLGRCCHTRTQDRHRLWLQVPVCRFAARH
jgi:hypothetical protein